MGVQQREWPLHSNGCLAIEASRDPDSQNSSGSIAEILADVTSALSGSFEHSRLFALFFFYARQTKTVKKKTGKD